MGSWLDRLRALPRPKPPSRNTTIALGILLTAYLIANRETYLWWLHGTHLYRAAEALVNAIGSFFATSWLGVMGERGLGVLAAEPEA